MNAKLPRTVTMRTAAESPVPPYAPSVPLTVPISLPPSSPIPPGSPLVPSATLPNSRGPTPVSAGSAPAQSKLLLSASDVVIDRNQKLGEGGFGVVYVGKLRGSVNVAVKVLRGEMDERTRAAFAKEVQTWEGLVQRNILPLMGFCVEPPMMITDLVEGGNLRQFLEARDWDQNLGRRFLLDIAQGMNYLHSMNILHGDLKSVNVLIDGNRALITDFGLSKMRSDATATMRSNRDLAGTPGFVAPEILMGEPLKKPADVFSFGMVCYEVLSRGKRPFEDAASPAAVGF